LVQEGNIGLLKAIDRFDHRRGYRLSTYASWWIKQSILRAITEQSRTIRLPEYVIAMINRITKSSLKLVQENGCDPTLEEIAKDNGLPLQQVKRIFQITEGEVSLKLFKTVKDSIFCEFPDDTKVISPVDALDNSKLQAQTNQALARLQPEEAEVLRMRFGLGKETTHTLEEVGRNLNLSREKIRQIETRALRKLKNMGGNQLRLLNES
jgi:RNA polymerase primary sigma factor